MNRTKRLCSLCFSKISSFQCYNDFYLEHDRFDKLTEFLKVVGFFLFFFLSCFVLLLLPWFLEGKGRGLLEEVGVKRSCLAIDFYLK